MNWLLLTSLVFLSAALGPGAGGRYGGSPISTISIGLVGLIIGYVLLGNSTWAVAGAAILFAGESPGVGHPKGYIADGFESGNKILEWWQPEALRHKPYWALTLRGAMFGTPALLITYWQPVYLWLIPAFAIALPLAMFIPVECFNIKGNRAWVYSEILQYPIVLILLILYMVCKCSL